MRAFAIAAVVIALPAVAQVFERPLRDPWVPPAVRAKSRVEAPAPTLTLQQQVEEKARATFAKAAPDGTLTRPQAEAAGLGFIAKHFDAIDTRGRGLVTADDYIAFLRARSAR